LGAGQATLAAGLGQAARPWAASRPVTVHHLKIFFSISFSDLNFQKMVQTSKLPKKWNKAQKSTKCICVNHQVQICAVNLTSPSFSQ
jgi:hypothetical protein